jgi:aspartate 1-decarboxylase
MRITILKSKIHRATVTQSSIDYEGSITIDADLMKACGLLPYEKVLVSNITNGSRLETYAIKGEPKTGIIGLNGAAAKLGKVGDKVTIMSFASFSLAQANKFHPKIVVLDEFNRAKLRSKI